MPAALFRNFCTSLSLKFRALSARPALISFLMTMFICLFSVFFVGQSSTLAIHSGVHAGQHLSQDQSHQPAFQAADCELCVIHRAPSRPSLVFFALEYFRAVENWHGALRFISHATTPPGFFRARAPPTRLFS
ncbi:MAG: hypothetical protein H7222_02990 [Methylotenera sp.]|nr:hypothetical protein [Oligoflexia bacterium]